MVRKRRSSPEDYNDDDDTGNDNDNDTGTGTGNDDDARDHDVGHHRRRHHHQKKNKRDHNKQASSHNRSLSRRQKLDSELAQLEKQCAELSDSDPAPQPEFSSLPLSRATLRGLSKNSYSRMTLIQRRALPPALRGKDVLGAAKTGSGKTLAFVIPLLDRLYRERWSHSDGLGALIITPTRELGIQIFEVLRKVGGFHEFSAGLLLGGKNVHEEKEVVSAMNILVATPGRLLQHLDEAVGFDATSLQVLVLDEADRILDMGFKDTLDAILSQLPNSGRQTLLFSATQTKSVKDLARLSLSLDKTVYCAVHDESSTPTPTRLKQQLVALVQLDRKLEVLYSFIRQHLQSKVIVFFTCCKQVQFVYETFCKLRPGIPLRALHGRMKQGKRMTMFYEFANADTMVLFATDIAARGLDFAGVDWVLQLDCPEDVAAYIHRVGRTARYRSNGKSLLILSPSELAMLEQLERAKIPVVKTKINPDKVRESTKSVSIGQRLASILSKDLELKHLAQKYMVQYLRAVKMQPNKAVFNLEELVKNTPAQSFAESLGLPGPPALRSVLGGPRIEIKPKHTVLEELPKDSLSNGNVLVSGINQDDGDRDDDSDSEDELLQKKSSPSREEDFVQPLPPAPAANQSEILSLKTSKHKAKKLKIELSGKQKGIESARLVFDDKGNAMPPLALLATEKANSSSNGKQEDPDEDQKIDKHALNQRWQALRALMKERDRLDKAQLKERLREKRKELRRKALRSARQETEEDHDKQASASDSDGGNDMEEDDDTTDEHVSATRLDDLHASQAAALRILKSRTKL